MKGGFILKKQNKKLELRKVDLILSDITKLSELELMGICSRWSMTAHTCQVALPDSKPGKWESSMGMQKVSNSNWIELFACGISIYASVS